MAKTKVFQSFESASVTGRLACLRVPATASALAWVLAFSPPAYSQELVAQAGQAAGSPETDNTNKKNPQSQSLEEVVVTGIRKSLESAQTIKQNSEQIVDSVVADDIGKLPDRSVTETLQRIPGITIDHFLSINDPDHFSVEGSGVNIRGLTYVRSELNGRDTFSANGGRTLSFEDVPPELMAGVDVYKSPTAEQIEGGLAGTVNLRTRKPFDFSAAQGQIINLSGQYTYGDLRRTGSPSGSLLYSNRWETGIGELGFLADFAVSKNATRTDAVQLEPFYPRTDLVPSQTVYIPKGADWRTLLFERHRTGAYLATQWRPNDRAEITAQFFQSRYKMHWDENAIFSQLNAYNVQPDTGTKFNFDSHGVFRSGTLTDTTDKGLPFNDDVRGADRHSTTSDGSLTGRFTLTDHLAFNTEFQYVSARSNSLDSTVATGINLPSQTLDLTGHVPIVTVPQSFLANPNNYYWAFTMEHLDDNSGIERSWRGDLEYSFDNDFFRSLRFGVRIADMSINNKSTPYNWQAITQQWMTGWYIDKLASLQTYYPERTTLYSFPNFFRGSVQLPGSVVFPTAAQANGFPGTYATLQSIRTQLCQQHDSTCNYAWKPVSLSDPGAQNVQTERTYATYVSLHFGSDSEGFPLSGNLGARVVRTETTDDGNIVFPNALQIPPDQNPGSYPSFNGSTIPVTVKKSYTDVLPVLNLAYRFTPKLQGRLAVSKGVVRPDFSQTQAYTQLSGSIDQTSGVLSLTSSSNTNPNLKPTRAKQLDGSLEWYFAPTGSVTAALFYKDLQDVIRTGLFSEQFAGLTFAVTSPENIASGKVRGVELAWQQFFDFLPGWMKGFGASANYTYVDSSSNATATNLGSNTQGFATQNGVDTDGTVFGKLPLEGLSKNSFNVAAFYERGPWQARLAYNWRSRYLLSVNVNGTQGTDGTPLSPNGVPCNNSAHCVVWGLPVYNDDYGQLDGSVFYKVSEAISVGVEAQNLNNAENRVLMQQAVPGIQGRGWFISDRRYTLQLRANF